jgi:prepilin-type N-terminal cleavage/methylation domain-containing protein
MKKKAFTLIELLVVIAIIALLLSIVMPGLRKAKQHALRLICKTNLHNYGIAGNLYLSENDERFPDPWQSLYDSCSAWDNPCSGVCTNPTHQSFPGESQRYCRWHNADYSLASHPEYAGPLWSYLESEEVNLCPVFRKVASKRGSEHPLHVASIEIEPQFGYSQNAYLGTSFFSGVLKMSGVRVPARTFYFAEENMWVLNQATGYRENLSSAVLNDTSLLARTEPTNASDYDDCFATFHSPPGGDYNEGTGNAVMLDGSVESVQPHEQGTFKKAWPGTAMAL